MPLIMQHLEDLFAGLVIQMIIDGEQKAGFKNDFCDCYIEIRIEGETMHVEMEWCDEHEQDVLGAYMGRN